MLSITIYFAISYTFMTKSLLIFATLAVLVSSSLYRIYRRSQIEGEVAGIILTFYEGSTFDNLFSQVTQQSKEGSVVLTYRASSSSQQSISQALLQNFTNADAVLREFVGKVEQLSQKCPSCIVFNWECSSGYSDKKFDKQGKYTFALLETIIKRGYLAMYSDFSLKALINQWNASTLGPNPFVQVGQTSTNIELKFNKDRLLRSPSAQLQAVAHLAEKDELTVNVLGGTIMYGVNSKIDPQNKYEIEVLTVASNFPAPQSYLQSKIDRYTGLAGHVLLSYPQGGKILTSMGHWIELMKIQTTEQQLFETAQILYGSQQAQQMKLEYERLEDQQQRVVYKAKKSKMFVQNQSPGSNKIYQSSKKGSSVKYDL